MASLHPAYHAPHEVITSIVDDDLSRVRRHTAALASGYPLIQRPARQRFLLGWAVEPLARRSGMPRLGAPSVGSLSSTSCCPLAWSVASAAYLFALPFWLPPLLVDLDGADLLVRAGFCVLVLASAGFLMGFGFPTGMRLVSGDRSSPSHVKRRGIADPSAKTVEFSRMSCLPRVPGGDCWSH
jgi:hypothetical protein